MTNSEREKILKELYKIPVCTVSSYTGTQIRSRMMHFAVSDDFKFYLASMKNDPKVEQILFHSEVSLLIHSSNKDFSKNKEVEVIGYARIVNDKETRKKAIKLLINRSPVVAQLHKINNIELLTFIEIIPIQIKFRVVKDILQGIPPAVIEFDNKENIESDFVKLKKKIKAWITETRYQFLPVTILPLLLGTTIAWAKRKVFDPFYFLLTLLGTIFLHLGTNIINDYFDHKSGTDRENREFVRPFSGGSRVIQLGMLTPLEVFVGAIILFILGSSIGLYLTYLRGMPVLFLGLIGVISGFFYTAPIFNWASKGFGELLVGFNFGVLVAMGSYYVQTGRFSSEVFWASLPLGILVSAILWINEIPDYTADKNTGKKTLVVRMGRKNAAKVFAGIVMLCYIILIISVLRVKLPQIVMIGFVSLPLAIQSIIYAVKFYDTPYDMAPGNGFIVLVFNILSSIMIISYLWLYSKKIYVVSILFILLAYIYWNYRTIMVFKKAKEAISKI